MSDFIMRGRSQQFAGEGERVLRVGVDGMIAALDRYAELAARGQVFSASRAAVTIPVNAATLVSVFGLYNPPSSGKMVEMIEAELQNVLATTVVNGYGLYFSNGSNASGATFTTQLQSAVQNGRIGEGNPSVCRFYSAVTHVGTPELASLIGGHGAVTTTHAGIMHRKWDGSLQFPPGTLISLAATTAASTASGMTGVIRWAEVPYVAQ